MYNKRICRCGALCNTASLVYWIELYKQYEAPNYHKSQFRDSIWWSYWNLVKISISIWWDILWPHADLPNKIMDSAPTTSPCASH